MGVTQGNITMRTGEDTRNSFSFDGLDSGDVGGSLVNTYMPLNRNTTAVTHGHSVVDCIPIPLEGLMPSANGVYTSETHPFILDAPRKRPRILVFSLKMNFNGVKCSEIIDVGGTPTPYSASPDTIEFYGSHEDGSTDTVDIDAGKTNLLFSFKLGNANFATNVTGTQANPFVAQGNTDDGELSFGNTWVNNNHLEVDLKFIMC